MIEQIKYAPIIKTGDAELKALANLDSKDKSLIFPIIELTRGKKSRNDTIGNLDKRINKLKEINLNGFFLDLTGDDVLSNIEIDILRSDTDGYKSWSPKDVADAAYYPLSENNDGTKILKEDVENFITNVDVTTIGEKTTVVNAHTRSGFDTVRHSSCVDPKNYSEELGSSHRPP